MDRLKDRVAIISGGAGGIGAATAKLFCEEGARVVIVGLPADPLTETADAIRAQLTDAQLLTVTADVSEEAQTQSIVERTLQHFGAIDVLVNLAGIRAYEPLAEARADTWERIIAVNLLSYAYLSRAALPALRRSGHGAIVNVSSTHGVNPRAGMGQYDATKAAIVSMTRTLAIEEVSHGVRVNAVCPGSTMTPFHARRAAAGGGQAQLDAEARNFNYQGRWADPREVAYPLLWLASDEASFVTGTALMVDGFAKV